MLGRARALAFIIVATGAFALMAQIGSAQQAKMPVADGELHLGVATCAGSTCHGAAAPLPGSNVLQNEFVTWQQKDKHHKAYEVLLNDRSKRIARNLGLESAQTASLCLDCHADNAAQDKRHTTFQISDGVTCESCHGGAGRWIGTHIVPAASHANNVRSGLFPTDSPVDRARLCLSCHFGDETRFVSHRMMGAGHPRMSFELDTFTALQPAHFTVDRDYRQRKQVASGVQLWAIGQAMAINVILDTMLDPERGMDGLFPELVAFDCHACHTPMSALEWAPRSGTAALGPGIPRFNDANLLMLQVITDHVDTGLGGQLRTQTNALHTATRVNHAAMLDAARALKAVTAQLIDKFADREFKADDMKVLLNGIIANGLKGEYVDYAGAEQASMAIGTIVTAMQNVGALDEDEMDDLNDALDMIFEAVDDDEKYLPQTFMASLRDFQQVVP
ncbi:MAG: multiheme c-type cytochrome [Proteobacteria bacterium]|nr:multiheme c-type cytochrome [Pseudomonadota bacterium]